jgi:hypothetical protein
MTTYAAKHSGFNRRSAASYKPTTHNYAGLLSFALSLVFILYLFFPSRSLFGPLAHFSLLFIMIIPVAAFCVALFSLRDTGKFGIVEKESLFGYASLGITSLYFITALAIPVVLIGFYILYAYIL